MREIKFRVWDKKLKEMNYLSLEDLCEDDYWYDGETSVWNVLNDCNDKNERFEIMQYTGLKDKNGVEIYEGDIVKNNWTSFAGKDLSGIWEVRFGEYDNSDLEYGSGGNIGFYAYSLKNGDEEGLNNLPCNTNDGIEVIGNIYKDLKESGE